jgi:anthranilate synthase component II
MLLMIDNYDSFTFNIVQYLAQLGEEVKVVRNDEISVADIAGLRPDRIVVSPGPCSPEEAGISVAAIKDMPARFRFWGSVWGISQSVLPLVARWCAVSR